MTKFETKLELLLIEYGADFAIGIETRKHTREDGSVVSESVHDIVEKHLKVIFSAHNEELREIVEEIEKLRREVGLCMECLNEETDEAISIIKKRTNGA